MLPDPEPQSHSTRPSKQDVVIAMLRQPEGATVDEVASVTGWQRYTVRGVFSGTLKKKLGLILASAKEERGRVYRIAEPAKIGERHVMALFIGEMGLGHDARRIEDGKLKRIGRDNGALGRRCTNRLGNTALRERANCSGPYVRASTNSTTPLATAVAVMASRREIGCAGRRVIAAALRPSRCRRNPHASPGRPYR
jgi:hypothetical protein